LFAADCSETIVAGVRNIKASKEKFQKYSELHFAEFDFANTKSYTTALKGINILFLLRPPQLADVELYFKPLLAKAKEAGIQKIVFLSVQGVEKSKVIPHHKIEKLIIQMGFEFIFVRPSYFMQNLTTTLLPEIQADNQITLPAGKAKFNWVDVENIGEVTARLLIDFDQFKNQAFEITGTENIAFGEIADLISTQTGIKIRYRSVSPFRFYSIKKKEGLDKGFILVMLLLHFLPRFQKEPRISNTFKKLIGKYPTTLQEFIEREKSQFVYHK
jgi:uncharacterized protein YbjT (DUF2867 family)